MKRYAVFGQPIRHSLSPRIHAAFGRDSGIPLAYEAVEVAPEAFAAVLERFHAEGGAGANITLPLKELAAKLAQPLGLAAQRAAAVNTLVRREDGWGGENTDGAGFMADLRRLGVVLDGVGVLILGAGGAVRGIVGPLLDAGVAEIVIANRSVERARGLVLAFADPRVRACRLDELADVPAPGLLVNAVSAAHVGESLHWPSNVIVADTVAYDLSYGRAAMPFLAWALSQGAALAEDGLGMLVEQAAEAFRLWHGVRPETATVLRDLRQVLS
ncbi:MAG: shikimate dehydrogenase [Xanthomonadales bacterium]|jgi:shikimate dehydrogenase|nr:shikimate dehydrogenase [Xanthomonadales bacterium]